MTDTYKCAECGETFEKWSDEEWSDEKAIAEAEAVLGIYDEENMVMVCDDCYQQIMKRHPVPSPEEQEKLVEKWKGILPTEATEGRDLDRDRRFLAMMLERQAEILRRIYDAVEDPCDDGRQ